MFGLGLIEKGIDAISSYVSKKQEQKILKQKHEDEITRLQMQADVEVAKGNALGKIELAKRGQMQNYDLDKMSMKNMEKSWKDEFLLLVFIVPMIMAFIPGAQELALKGFAVVAKMPDWYVAFIIGMGVVIYGLRNLLKWFISNKISIFRKER